MNPRTEAYLEFAGAEGSAGRAVVLAGTVGRYIAETQKIELVTPDSELQKAWGSLVTFCGSIRCELVSSSITTKAEDSTPTGSISLRVVPEDAGKLFAEAEKFGKITRHTTEREDKTTAVIDTEAKIKNLTSFRDNLRNMLGKPSATVKDLVEIQQQLMETQSQLDSEAAQRKVLANETEKIFVQLLLRVPRNASTVSGWGQIGNAFRRSGSILAESTASVIETVVAIIPWLIFILPAIWLARKLWRRSRRRPPSASVAPTATR
jgi:cob(I)alamin adenosyltransferase